MTVSPATASSFHRRNVTVITSCTADSRPGRGRAMKPSLRALEDQVVVITGASSAITS
jgi:hypothetical protein